MRRPNACHPWSATGGGTCIRTPRPAAARIVGKDAGTTDGRNGPIDEYKCIAVQSHMALAFQPSSARTNCWMGKASANSLAITIIGPARDIVPIPRRAT